MSVPEPDRDDADLKALFDARPGEAPPSPADVDTAFLERLSAQSLAEFEGAGSAALAPDLSSPSLAPQPLPLSQSEPIRRSRTMLTLLFRGLVALSAVVAGVAVWLSSSPESLSAAPFSKVLERLAAVDSMQLRLVRHGQNVDVWVRSPGQVRIDDTPARYRIARGGSLWQIDEQANTLVAVDSGRLGPQLFTGKGNSDFNFEALLELCLPGVGTTGTSLTGSIDLRDLIPVRRLAHGGRDCVLYQTELPVTGGDRPATLEAIADARSYELLSFVVHEAAGDKRQAVPTVELRLIALNIPVDESKFVLATTLSDDGRVGKVTDVQGIAGLRPLNAQRWTCTRRDLIVKPGDWIRTELRGANAVAVSLTSQVQLVIGPGSLVEVLSPTQVRLHSGEMQVTQPGGVPVATISTDKAANAKPDEGKPAPKQAAAPLVKLIPLVVLAPQAGSHTFDQPGKQLVRVTRDETLLVSTKVDAEAPLWLKGFEGATSNESLGSLIVKLPDGRSAPLAVGVHLVSVDIRDQIARTTIEETFVNSTASRLEGVFHFPLPQEASISGFGMWIGNELVEADIVEKQRAREIYETILSEKRDPGLLEWTGGNIFSARVFPIEPHSEKRVKIAYTQVLPLRANTYRYNYGLRSELLQTRPLRELGLTVTVQSAIPLKQVKCSSHPARIQQTANSGRVEYAAQEVTPTRDFEVVCEIDGRQSDVVMIPHRRGDDGYFLLQLTPPSPGGNWQRELLPEGKPLDLLLLCDTSGSMDKEKRKQQSACVAALLASLGPADRFNVATVDVRPEWLFDQSVAPSEQSLAKVSQTLDNRVSLGWTDLDKAFDSAATRATATSQTIYLGDGIVATVESDPQAFLKRMAERTAGSAEGKKASVRPIHCIGVGNSFESVVLQGLSRLTSGSTRTISGEMTPQIVAMELLNEIAQPGLSDINVEYRGIKVAAVYPGKLPNVAAGTQQILVGRYLPEAQKQTGEVVVTAKRGGETVRYATKVTLPERRLDSPASQAALKNDTKPGSDPLPRETAPDDDASFIPRLWARGRLDELLHQGSSGLIRDEIIALSEEFHIITPYTSLLVLESDKDRERFGVKRRFEMRDGERFFAEGRSLANEELRQKQLQQAAGYRREIRQRILQDLAKLGRHPLHWQAQPVRELLKAMAPGSFPMSGGSGGWGGGGGEFLGDELRELDSVSSFGLSGDKLQIWDSEVSIASEAMGRRVADQSEFQSMSGSPINGPWGGTLGGMAGFGGRPSSSEWYGRFESDLGLQSRGTYEPSFGFGHPEGSRRMAGLYARDRAQTSSFVDESGAFTPDGQMRSGASAYYLDDDIQYFPTASPLAVERYKQQQQGLQYGLELDFKSNRGRYRNPESNSRQYIQWFDTLFPALPPVPFSRSVEWSRRRDERLDRESKWSPEAIALSNSLVRRPALAKIVGGVEITRTTESFDPRWSRMSSRSRRLELYSPQAWLTRPIGPGHTVVNWSNTVERGVFSQAFQVGRIRPAVEADRQELPLELDDWSLAPIHRSYRDQSARIEPAGEGQVTLIVVFTNPETDDEDLPAAPVHEYRVLIDTVRHVVLKIQDVYEGTPPHTKSFTDFVEVAGQWWPQTTTVVDPIGRKTSEIRQTVTLLAADPFQQRLNAELAGRSSVLFAGASILARQPQPGDDSKPARKHGTSVAEARQRVADGSATTDDRLLLILSECTKQNLAAAVAQVDALEKLAADKPGTRWVRAFVWQALRENDLLRQQLLAEAQRLAPEPQTNSTRDNERFLADTVRGMAFSVTGYPEFLELLTIIRPVYERQPVQTLALHDWLGQQAGCFQALNRLDEELAILQRLATEAPWQISHHTQYAQRLEARGDRQAADAWIRQQIDRRVPDGQLRAGQPVEWHEYELQQLFQYQATAFHQRGEFQRLITWSVEWAERMPANSIAYSHRLSALVFNDQYAEAVRLATQWIDEAVDSAELNPAQRTRLDVATEFALGHCQNLNMQEMDPTWHPKLPATALAFLNQRRNFQIGSSLFSRIDSRDFDEVDLLRLHIFRTLVREAATLDPTRLASFAQWALTGRMKFPANEKPANDELAIFRDVDLQAMQARPMSADLINAAWKSLGDRREFESSEVPSPIWVEIAKVIRLRWETEQKPNRKRVLGETLLNVYRSRMVDQRLPFLHDLLAVADDEHRPAAALALFDALLAEPWTDAIETELFALLPRLAPKPTLLKTKEANRGELAMRLVPQLQRLVDALIASREAATNRALLDGGKAHELTRIELAEQQATARHDARQGVADRLARYLKLPAGPADEAMASLVPWFEIESLTLDVQLERNLEQVTATCWKLVDPQPADAKPVDEKVDDDDEEPDEDEIAVQIDADMRSIVRVQLKERALALLMHLAVRTSAPAGDVERLLKFIDSRLALIETPHAADGPADATRVADQQNGATDSFTKPDTVPTAVHKLRALKYRLLVALDRPEDLERQLRAWIAADKSLTSWRVALGWLQAERGGLPEAVQMFEAAQKDGLLGPREVRALGDWYLVLDRREDHRRALLAAQMLRSEHELYQVLANQRHRFIQINSSTELDDETLLMIEALLRKSTSPESYFWVIRELYAATRDFRVLAMVPDASLGRSPQQAYTYLNAVRSQLLSEVHNEATTDPLIARIRTLRDAPVKPGTTDRDVTRQTELRALDLLEALVESQAANVLNQPGPHITAAVAAMQRAFARTWSEGEPRLMASHLYNLGRLPHQPLIDEQIRELKALARQTAAGSGDHLHIIWHQASLLHQHYAQSDTAETLMDATVRIYLADHASKWNSEDQDVLAGWIGLLNDRHHYAKGEALIAQRQANPFNDQQLPWLKEQWFGLQLHALGQSGETSLGKGVSLLKKIADLQMAEIRATQDANHRYNLLVRLPSVYQAAHNAQIKEAAGLFREYAFQTFPDLMKTQLVNYSSLINHTVGVVDQLLGSRDAVWWLAERIESYPRRLEYSWENPWNQHGHSLGHYRWTCVDRKIPLGDAEPVLLRVVLTDLRRELSTRRQRYTAITRNHNQHFWAEKSADFAKVAEEVLAAHRDSGRVQRYVAEYQYSGLNRANRAIEILFAARKQGRLDASGESVLINYLMGQSRFGEAVALLEPLVKSAPNVLGHRTLLMRAYHGTQRPQLLRELLMETDAYFHKEGRWTEAVMAELARACEDTGLSLESTQYYTQAISYHQRHAPGRGIGDNTLWGYYHQMAHQFIHLKQTREAVDAAASALICFPPSHHLRIESMKTMRSALQLSPDLNAYIRFLDERARTDNQDSALLRKSAGRVYQEQGKLEPAITQYKLALDLQPLDQETQQWLMESLDATGLKHEATGMLLTRIDLERHNLDLYKQLAQRLKDDEAQAERAATSIVEADPNEATNHAALADWREQQNRWDEALLHWQQFVKLRRLDPTGLVRLARVQVKLNQTMSARESLKQLEATTWPPRYNTIPEDIRQLKEQLR